ncbi:MAG TPA: pyridoxal phosphate-dependent aminotransferase [Candidatus Bathyarchaeia archaeon]|nr:pyridoxal phosphate-dependent aminotransferase [Candidatus Bathyarchaeia archaeon]
MALKLPEGVIRLTVGEPDFETPEVIREAGKRAIDEGITHYTPIMGFDDLRKAVAQKLRRENNVSYDYEDEVLITSGSSSGIYLTLQSLIDPGDEVLVPDPGWFHYVTLIELCGGKPVPLPIAPGSSSPLNLEDLDRLVSKKSKALILNSPSNPTGTVLSEDTIKAVGDFAEEHDLIIISDEIYERIIYAPNVHFSPASLSKLKPRTLTFNGFSKAYAMTGWRIGYVAGPSDILQKVIALNGYILVCASSMSQRAALAALTEPRAEDSVKRMASKFAERRDTVLEKLNSLRGLEICAPQGAFYTWIDVSGTRLSGEQFSQKLIGEEKVGVLPGILFGARNEKAIRISFATGEDRLKDALERFSNFVNRYASS